MKIYDFNESIVTKFIIDTLLEITELKDSVYFSNPSTASKFPCCVVQHLQQRPKKQEAQIDLSITIEVWASSNHEVLKIFGLVKNKLRDINIILNNTTPGFTDPVTNKHRYGGYFEVRYNGLTNSLERNR